MPTPEQQQSLATISSLAASLRTQKLSDVQIDLLQIAEHLMTNIAVQTTLNCATQLVEYQIGEPVNVDLAALGMGGGQQRTTVTGRQKMNDLPEYLYHTAVTGRDVWVDQAVMSKVQK